MMSPLQGAGFTTKLGDHSSSNISHSRTIRKWKVTFLFSLIFAIPTVIVAFAPVDWSEIVPGLTPRDVVLFLLSTIIQVREERRKEGGRVRERERERRREEEGEGGGGEGRREEGERKKVGEGERSGKGRE